MAAPRNNFIRVRLRYESNVYTNSWMFIDMQKHVSIANVIQELKYRNDINEDTHISLWIGEFVLPHDEPTMILKDEDEILVRIAQSCSDTSKEKCLRKRKSEKQAEEDINIISGQIESHSVKKAKKEDVHLLKADGAETTGNVDRHSKKKKKKHYKEVVSCDKTNDTDKNGLISMPSNVSMLENESDLTDGIKEFSESLVDKDTSKQNTGSDDSVEENTGNTTETKKRRRIRKRKRKNKKSVPVVDNLPNSDISINVMSNKVQEGDTFFGRLPDKLEPPKYYRTGYRNLKTYQAQPNLHRKFDSGSDVEEGSMEQYNFLSKPKQSDNIGDVNISVGNSFEDDSQNDSLIAVKIEVKDRTCTSDNHKTNNAMLTDQAAYMDGYLDTISSNPGKKVPCTQWGTSSNTFETSTPGEPAQLTRVTLANGASLFRRQRATMTPFKELNKEQQLNDVAFNKSTIFRNDGKGTPVTPESPLRSHTASITKTPTIALKDPAVAERVDVMSSDSPASSGDQATVQSNDNLQVQKSSDVSTATNAANFHKLPPLVGMPAVGDKIVYKVLEISASCTPEVSDFKVAIVTKVDDNQMIELQNQQQAQASVPNKFHVEIEDEDAILTNFQQPQDVVCLHVSSLLDARILQHA